MGKLYGVSVAIVLQLLQPKIAPACCSGAHRAAMDSLGSKALGHVEGRSRRRSAQGQADDRLEAGQISSKAGAADNHVHPVDVVGRLGACGLRGRPVGRNGG